MKLSDYIANLEEIRSVAGDVEVMLTNPSGGCGSFGFAVTPAGLPRIMKYSRRMGTGMAIADDSAIPVGSTTDPLTEIVLLG
jgi:hypothetical protein